MTHMPTETDLATKADLAALAERLDARFDGIDARQEQVDSRFDRLEAHMVRFDAKLDGFHEALRDQSRTYMLTTTGVMASFAAVVVATGILK
jgi:ribosome assembly protein YihI (activator of Der GTPase)